MNICCSNVENISKLSYPGKDKLAPKAVLKFKSLTDANIARRQFNQLDNQLDVVGKFFLYVIFDTNSIL